MLLRFVAQNFLSIADEVELNMFPAPRLRKHPNHVYQTPQVELLKAAAIYGANGSGKSNIVKAMAYLKQIVVEGDISNPFENNEIKFKLSEEFQSQPTHFEIEFKQHEKYYSYGIDFDENIIYEEWLYELDIKTEKDELIFERKLIDDKIKLKLHPSYLKTEKDKLRIELYEEEMLEKHIPFVSFLLGKDNFHFYDVYFWFLFYYNIIFPNTPFNYTDTFKLTTNQFNNLKEIIKKLDIGIENIELLKYPFEDIFNDMTNFNDVQEGINDYFNDKSFKDNVLHLSHQNQLWKVAKSDKGLIAYQINTQHLGSNNKLVSFSFNEESDGTNRLLDILPFLNWIINNQGLIFIDEIGRSLHPSLLKKLVTLIMKTPTKGQIIFTTHDSHLLDLDIFRPDEIWFVEKNEAGRTKTYTMSDFKPRYDENIEKGYLMGRFGAIPYLGDLGKLEMELTKEIVNTD